jgi:hypothetical protein
LNFEVTKGGGFQKKRFIEVNMEEYTILQSRKNNEHSKKYTADTIVQIIRSRKDPKKVKIR